MRAPSSIYLTLTFVAAASVLLVAWFVGSMDGAIRTEGRRQTSTGSAEDRSGAHSPLRSSSDFPQGEVTEPAASVREKAAAPVVAPALTRSLIVQLADLNGAPWEGGLRLVGRRRGAERMPSEWPEHVTVAAYAAEVRGGAPISALRNPDAHLRIKRFAGSRLMVETDSARAVLVCAVGGNQSGGHFDGTPAFVARLGGC